MTTRSRPWYPPEECSLTKQPPYYIITIIDIRPAGVLTSREEDVSQSPLSQEQIVSVCLQVSSVPEFSRRDSFILVGEVEDDTARSILIVNWPILSQPPPDLLEIVTQTLDSPHSIIAVTDLLNKREPYSIMPGLVELIRWRLPPDHGIAEKQATFKRAFAEVDEYC